MIVDSAAVSSGFRISCAGVVGVGCGVCVAVGVGGSAEEEEEFDSIELGRGE